ncbi:stage II sporulation protein M [Paenibacillus jamilae]
MLRFSSWWNTLKQLRWYLIAAVLLFAVGYVLGNQWSGFEGFIMEQLKGIQGMRDQLMQSDNQELSFFVFIFYNNAIKAVMIMFAGIVLGIVPAGFLIINGMVIGLLLRIMESQGLDLASTIIKGILPHGILEIPAILIAGAYGMRFGILILQRIFSRRMRAEGPTIMDWIKQTGAGAVWVTAMLLVAAIIESTVTFWLMNG